MSGSRKQPVLTLIAGPNGSGKSTIVNGLVESYSLGILVNADVIAASLAKRKHEPIPSRDTQWAAAVAAEEMRWALLYQHISFSTETVMSDRTRWLTFIQEAKAQGYRIVLFFVTTDDPAINVARVGERVKAGGHAVDPDKIVDRYHKTMWRVLPEVLKLVNEAILFDNSHVSGAVPVLHWKGGKLSPLEQVDCLPGWARKLFSY